ncbi:5-bromo-4-chloroindolyl phosphate hydrolysis family protein [Rhodobacteraceae bacterium NNCM2]|nr:5-bromo-4-chloroindolyl phosphate hydrolysis family protein [Coraliihabitans acroporae]
MSAQKFGGAHSPGGNPNPGAASSPAANKFRNRKAASVGIRGLVMFILPTPLLLAALGHLGSNAFSAIGILGAYACLMLGAWLLREGQTAEAAYNARQIARPPAFPRKLCAAALAGIGVAGAIIMTEGLGDLIQAIGLGAIAVVSHIASFGLDPMKSKGIEGKAAPDHVIDAIDKAEARVNDITRMAGTLRDREITNLVEGLMSKVREMLTLVQEDPRDLSRARRYFTVYLKGAEDATRKYVENHVRLDDPKLRSDYISLIGELEDSFGRGREMLLHDDRTDLEVEIEVLRERLGQERA